MLYDKYFKKSRPDISISSIKSYSGSLKTLAKKIDKTINEPKDIIDNIDIIIDSYKDMKPTSRKTHMSAIISFIDDGSPDKVESLVKLRKLLSTDISKYNTLIDSQKKSDTYEENWIEWPDIIKKYNAFEKEITPLWKIKKEDLSKSSYNKLKMYVLLSCLILISPRRNLDQTAFKIRNINIQKDNYMKGKKFIFNSYKTSKTYGTTEVDIPTKLHSIIKKWMLINDSDYLITGNNDRMKNITAPQLTNMLNTFFNKRVSVNLLRHSFLTHVYKDLPDLKEMKDRAKDMSHDLSQALQYIKKD
jgi:hypothetical protein